MAVLPYPGPPLTGCATRACNAGTALFAPQAQIGPATPCRISDTQMESLFDLPVSRRASRFPGSLAPIRRRRAVGAIDPQTVETACYTRRTPRPPHVAVGDGILLPVAPSRR